MNSSDLFALSSMLGGSADQNKEKAPATQPMMTPASIGPKQVLPMKDIPSAVPYSLESGDEDKTKSKGDIWGEDDDAVQFDARKRPEVSTCVFQRVTSEDIFLGMGTKDPGTTTADGIKLTVSLPGETDLASIELDVQEHVILVSTPNYLLKETLPRPVDASTAKAEWNGAKSTLVVRCHVKPGEYDFMRH